MVNWFRKVTRFATGGLVKQAWLWVVAFMSAVAFVFLQVIKQNKNLGRENDALKRRVEAAHAFRANRKKARDMDISDMLDDLDGMFPPKQKRPGPKT